MAVVAAAAALEQMAAAAAQVATITTLNLGFLVGLQPLVHLALLLGAVVAVLVHTQILHYLVDRVGQVALEEEEVRRGLRVTHNLC
jgi:hypothetical protein